VRSAIGRKCMGRKVNIIYSRRDGSINRPPMYQINYLFQMCYQLFTSYSDAFVYIIFGRICLHYIRTRH